MLEINLLGKAPIYEQIYNSIAGLISAGALSAGEKLPAVREIAKQLGINPNTVQKSYFMLEQAGLIYSIPAKGSYVCESAKAAQALCKLAAEKLLRELGAAKTAGISKEAAQKLLDEVYSEEKGENV